MQYLPPKETPVLIVDDDKGFLLTIKEILISAGMPEPALVSDSRDVMALLEKRVFKFILIDLLMPHLDGLALLKQIKSSFADTECVMVTASDDINSAVRAMKIGAYDYMTKPLQYDKLIILIKRAIERYCLRQGLSLFERNQPLSKLANPELFQDMVAQDLSMARILRQVEMIAPTEYSVVITGESGTGKEMLAKKIHQLSLRDQGPFVAVNMGAVSETLFKDELFGHKKGAYTGAAADKKAFFESAKGGTLFLDEITDLDISLQSGLLRVLQEKEYYRVGSTRTTDADTRILVATNRNIADEIKKKRFRADLFHRLNMFHIDIPPLRERKEDILPLARIFLKQFADDTGKHIDGLSSNLENFLLAFSFPGNVRELKNMIAAAVLMEKSNTLGLDSISKEYRDKTGAPPSDILSTNPLWPLARVEKNHILSVLEQVNGNRTKAAGILGIGRKTLQRKLKSYAS